MTAIKSSSSTAINLPQLQNLMKRDPESYLEELEQQLRHFSATLKVFEMNPGEHNRALEEVVMFLAQVAKCYAAQLSTFPQTLVSLLRKHSTVLDGEMRMSFCRALILLRHRNMLEPSELLTLFFDMLRCQDKALRSFLRDHIVGDIRGINANKKDVRLNCSMQNFMFKMLADSHVTAAKTSLDVMTELYRKGVWKDERTVNVIATACFSSVTKIMVAAVKFFLEKDDEQDANGGKDSDSDDDVQLPSMFHAKLVQRVNNKNVRKRQKMLENIRKAHKKKERKEKRATAAAGNFSAIHLVHDPQDFAEKLFKKLESLRGERYEVRLLFMDLVSRLIGIHQLFLLNYYAHVARLLQPHQREVVQLLQFAAQAAHELVPADSVEPVLRAIVNNFVSERNTAEVMAVGLNAIRELCKRCPLVMDDTLMRDLAQYKSYKDKGVMMAARSLIALYRASNPELLHKKDRGRPTEALEELRTKRYGETIAKDYLPGAEELAADGDGMDGDADTDEANSEGWQDVARSNGDLTDDENSEEDELPDDDAIEGNSRQPKDEVLSTEEKRSRAREVTTSRMLTDSDFKKIDAVQLKKTVSALRKGGRKRKREEDLEIRDALSKNNEREELVGISDIEMVYKKRKHDKESRLATVMKGREGREAFGSKRGKGADNTSTTTGSTNKTKAKKKNFSMLKHKIRRKAKRSFFEKQQELKKSMIRSRKFK